ncbi:MauE/DoxX family redox-associated membrane protein [Pedobacter sp. ASV1-7]|uniref:MauE/DoxX family redox-associated membrane protein n=1 Tax=Pedobacter sp. ASV1-7 TaxID=3145237 RepID=UPI0032E8F528
MNNRFTNLFTTLSVFLLVVLFVYTASDKLWNMSEFQRFLLSLQWIGPAGKLLAWTIPLLELLISVLLLVPLSRRVGLLSAFILMISFTSYLVLMKLFGSNVPCHCGGVISELTWLQHIWLNVALIVMSGLALLWYAKGQQTTFKNTV